MVISLQGTDSYYNLCRHFSYLAVDMIAMHTFTFLLGQKRNDALALLARRRYPAAIYWAGYTVEIALKRKICHTLGFTNGFPENPGELNTYITQLQAAYTAAGLPGTPLSFTKIGEIRNHDLKKLLFYSGKELHIKGQFLDEWNVVAGWHPEQRYLRLLGSSGMATRFLNAAAVLVREIA
jgi:hypothetical protein